MKRIQFIMSLFALCLQPWKFFSRAAKNQPFEVRCKTRYLAIFYDGSNASEVVKMLESEPRWDKREYRVLKNGIIEDTKPMWEKTGTCPEARTRIEPNNWVHKNINTQCNNGMASWCEPEYFKNVYEEV